MAQSAKKEILSETLEIEQLPRLTGEPGAERKPEVMFTDPALKRELSKEYLAELAFNEEPVLVRLEEGGGDNAVKVFPIWNNGVACELKVGSRGLADNLDDSGRWMQMPNGFAPVGIPVVMKRKYLATLAGAKQQKITTIYGGPGSANEGRNEVDRPTSSSQVFSVLEDRNPRGRAWLTELMRRNF